MMLCVTYVVILVATISIIEYLSFEAVHMTDKIERVYKKDVAFISYSKKIQYTSMIPSSTTNDGTKMKESFSTSMISSIIVYPYFHTIERYSFPTQMSCWFRNG